MSIEARPTAIAKTGARRSLRQPHCKRIVHHRQPGRPASSTDRHTTALTALQADEAGPEATLWHPPGPGSALNTKCPLRPRRPKGLCPAQSIKKRQPAHQDVGGLPCRKRTRCHSLQTSIPSQPWASDTATLLGGRMPKAGIQPHGTPCRTGIVGNSVQPARTQRAMSTRIAVQPSTGHQPSQAPPGPSRTVTRCPHRRARSRRFRYCNAHGSHYTALPRRRGPRTGGLTLSRGKHPWDDS